MRYLLLILLLVLQSCSDVRVSQDYVPGYNFTSLKTFAWRPGVYGVKGNEIVDERIRKVIVERLSARGYQLTVTRVPDFFVSYEMKVEQKIESDTATGGIAIGSGGYGRYGGIGLSTGGQVRTYDQGTLQIDFTNPVEDRLIWRGISTQTVEDHSSPEESKERINETVEKILSQFPPEN